MKSFHAIGLQDFASYLIRCSSSATWQMIAQFSSKIFQVFEEEIPRDDGANGNSQVFALGFFFQTDLVWKMIGFLRQVLVIVFSACKSINHDFLWLDSFLKQEKDSLIVKGNLYRNSIVTLSDNFVVLAR